MQAEAGSNPGSTEMMRRLGEYRAQLLAGWCPWRETMPLGFSQGQPLSRLSVCLVGLQVFCPIFRRPHFQIQLKTPTSGHCLWLAKPLYKCHRALAFLLLSRMYCRCVISPDEVMLNNYRVPRLLLGTCRTTQLIVLSRGLNRTAECNGTLRLPLRCFKCMSVICMPYRRTICCN